MSISTLKKGLSNEMAYMALFVISKTTDIREFNTNPAIERCVKNRFIYIYIYIYIYTYIL